MSGDPGSTASEQSVRAQLQRLLEHPEFTATPQRRAFLTYVIDEALAGRAGQIKGVSIAMSVFGRDDSFDQQADPIVRLEARRLRQDIDGYYAGPGRDDPLRIWIPKGSYVPRFEVMSPAVSAEVAIPEHSGSPIQLKYIGFASGIVGALAVLLFAWIYLFNPGGDFTSSDEANLPKGPVIAVLPFASLGDGPSYIADGITQQLTTELVRFRDLWVLPLGNVARFRDGQSDLRALETEFDADFVLEGSVTAAVGTLKISARLVDLETGRYIWVQSYDTVSSPTEIYETQNRITHDVIGNLAGKYGILAKDAMNAAVRSPPEHRSAYDCVLEYYSYQITINLKRHGEVKACIERAVQLEPDYAEAWAVLSNLYLQEIRFALGGDRQKVFQAAKAAARRAVALDPHSASAHLMLANVRFVAGDLEGFRQSGSTAVQLNPNDNAVLAHYGLRLSLSGSWEEGLAVMDKAIALNPVHPHWYWFPKIFYLFDQGEYDAANSVLNKVDMPGFFWTHIWRTVLSEELGNHAAAQDSLGELLKLQPDFVLEAENILSIWQLDGDFKKRLMQSLNKAGLKGGL